MATIVRYVNTASSGGDGTTNGTAGGTAAYASLDAAEAALRQDLTSVTCDALDEDGNAYIALDILCTGSAADTTAIDFDSGSWVTDATHRIRVRLNGTGAGPKWDDTLYRLVVSRGGNDGVFRVGAVLHMTLVDLQMENTVNLVSQSNGVRFDADADIRIIGGMIRTTGADGGTPSVWSTGISINASVAYKLRMRNVAVVMRDGRGILGGSYNTADTDVFLYNCTWVNRSATERAVFSVSGGNGSGAYRYKNNVIQGPGTSNYSASAADEALTNLTQDATSPTVGLRSKTLTFVDAANYDYHLVSGDTDAIGAGTDLSADSYWPFAVDGDGETRTGAWDVGADQLVVTGSSLELEGFRGLNDDGDEASATFAAAQDATIPLPIGTRARVRTLIDATGDPDAGTFQYDYRKQGETPWLPLGT